MDFLKKFKELFVDATLGLVKQYQAKSLDIVKINAAACYIRGVQVLRQQVLVFTLILFLVAMAAVAVVAVPLVLLALTPWSREVKLVVAVLLGAVDISLPLFMAAHFLSEKKWMEFTKSDELIDSLTKES